MKNQDVWDVANTYSNGLLFKVAIGLCAIQVLFYFLLPGETGIIAIACLEVAGVIMILPLTERYLKTLFDKEGNRL